MNYYTATYNVWWWITVIMSTISTIFGGTNTNNQEYQNIKLSEHLIETHKQETTYLREFVLPEAHKSVHCIKGGCHEKDDINACRPCILLISGNGAKHSDR